MECYFRTGTNYKHLLAVSLAAFLSFIGLLIVLFSQAERLVAVGIFGNVWYLLLILIGAFCAISLHYLFQSSGSFSGKVFGGKIKLVGPGVLMLAIVALGFYYAPQPQTDFDFTVFVVDGQKSTPLKGQGQLSLDLGADRRVVNIGPLGEARFINISASFRDQSVAVTLLNGFPYVLGESSTTIKLAGEVGYLTLEVQKVTLNGQVLSSSGEPLANARVRVQSQQAQSDRYGHFSLTLPGNMTEVERVIEVEATGYKRWHGNFIFGNAPLKVALQAL